MVLDPIILDDFVLRPLHLMDPLQSYLQWMRSPRLLPFIESARESYTMQDLHEYITVVNASPNAVQYGIFLQDSMRHIGNIKFHDIDFKNRSSFVGFLIGDIDWQNRGVAKKVFVSSSSLLFKLFEISLYRLGVNASNLQAIHAYKKMGFVNSVSFQTINRGIFQSYMAKHITL